MKVQWTMQVTIVLTTGAIVTGRLRVTEPTIANSIVRTVLAFFLLFFITSRWHENVTCAFLSFLDRLSFDAECSDVSKLLQLMKPSFSSPAFIKEG